MNNEKSVNNKNNKNEKRKTTKTKRKKTIEKRLCNMKIYFVNIRGWKSKKESIESIIEELKPDIVGIVETHLERNEKVEVEGYTTLRNDRNEEGGGILLMAKEIYKETIIEVERTNDTVEGIWVTMGTKQCTEWD